MFPNDAEDIKAHPFFRDIDWDHMHRTIPPFIPRVQSNQSITKYFEDEKEILSDADDDMERDSSETVDEGRISLKTKTADQEPSDGKTERKRREKKRPRDKILRDPGVKKEALEARQKNAFLGYTYRRPKTLLLEDQIFEGGISLPRMSVLPGTA